MVYLTRKVRFSSAHRYVNHDLSDEENKKLFGKCYNPHGHGHNYLLEVTVCGDVEQRTGMVVNMVDLDQLLQEEVVDVFDHRHINEEVPGFEEAVPTSENIARYLWSRINIRLNGCALYCLRLHEDESFWVDYYGDTPPPADRLVL